MAQLRAVPPLPAGLRLAVVTAGLNTGADGGWRQSQAALAALSTTSRHIVLEGAEHTGLWADPRFAPATVGAILNLIEAVQSGRLD
jgi:hypothetical protein